LARPPSVLPGLAARLAKEIPGSFFADQFNNPPTLAHETSTGPEIWQQCGHELDAIVVGVGSGGTLTGWRAFKPQPQLKIVLADPAVRSCATWRKPASTALPARGGGIGEDFVPRSPTCRWSRRRIRSRRRELPARELLTAEACSGSSTGTLAAAPRFCREQKEPKRVVTFVCDTGTRYLSKVYNDAWMIDEGLLKQRRHGDLRDLIARRTEDGSVSAWPAGHAAHHVPAHAAGRHAAIAGARQRPAWSAWSTNPTCCCACTKTPRATASRWPAQ
jgi:cystathionine beta-synthase